MMASSFIPTNSFAALKHSHTCPWSTDPDSTLNHAIVHRKTLCRAGILHFIITCLSTVISTDQRLPWSAPRSSASKPRFPWESFTDHIRFLFHECRTTTLSQQSRMIRMRQASDVGVRPQCTLSGREVIVTTKASSFVCEG